MSELKEHQFCESDEFFREYPGPLSNETHLYYLKSEADKVIADKDEEIDELQKATDSAWSKVNAMYDELRHHKYKRCMDMAKWCNDKWLVHNFAEIPTKLGFYDKWEKRWLELAEKFKPNSTHQQKD